MSVHKRKNRSVFRFSGPDAQKLLNDVLTAKFEKEPGKAAWWALLSPQGKVQAEGLVSWDDGAFWLDVDAEAADSFFKRMKMYRLRAQVDIDDLRDTQIVGFAEDDPKFGVTAADARHPALGYRVILPKAAEESWLDDDVYAAARIGLGIVEVGNDYAADTLFPHDMGMDFLSGVDFTKGCYVGQEVVSRMQHRGTARRRPVIVRDADAQRGDNVECAGRSAGEIGQVIDGKAVAILRLDRITRPNDATINGKPVTLVLPSWAGYDFADSAQSPDEDDS